MVEVKSTLSGFFPRSRKLREGLKEVGGLQKDGMKEETKEEVDDLIDEARSVILELQEENEVDVGVEGQLLWDDLLAYPATKIDGFEMTGLIRYYNTNRFYRKPVIKQEIEKNDHFCYYENKKAMKNSELDIKPIITGPFTLLNLSENQYYNSNEEALEKITEVISSELEKLNELDPTFVQIDEPSLTKNRFDDLRKVYRELSSSSDSNLIVNSYFGCLEDNFYELRDYVDGVGMDLVRSKGNWDLIKGLNDLDILQVGLIDSKNTRIEDEVEIKSEIDKILSNVDIEQLLVSNNLYLDFLPWSIMKKKVSVLNSTLGGY